MNLNIVTENLLLTNNLNKHEILSILDIISNRCFDYADFYFQSKFYEMWVIENSIIKLGTFNINQGVGVRVIKDEKTGFAYTDQITRHDLIKSAVLASSIIDKKQDVNTNFFLQPVEYKSRYFDNNPLSAFSQEEKIHLLTQIDKIARACDTRVEEVTATLFGSYEQILVIATDGTLAADIRPLVKLSINIQVEKDGKRERGFSGGGGRCDYSFFLKKNIMGEVRYEHWVREAVRIALINFSALNAPAGTMPVVLGSGWPGILLHEAVGHGLEGDFNRRSTSVFSNKIGQQVASELCTVVDDGTINNYRGSLSIDDEGVPSNYNILIEKGILKGYMQDKLNAKLMDMVPTGNGRRESYAHLPMPRMTNTYMLSGSSTHEEIISSVDYGIYAPNFSSGQVDITSGQFVFSTSEAYLIKNGKITSPVKGVTLIGSGIEIMQQVSMIGNNLLLDEGLGICIKNGQSIPVGVGQPTVKLNKITVGGTS